MPVLSQAGGPPLQIVVPAFLKIGTFSAQTGAPFPVTNRFWNALD